MRWAARRDANEPAIIQALNLAGWNCFPISAPGWPDLLAVRHGSIRLLELKTKSGKLRQAQTKLHLRLLASGVVVYVVRTPEEAVAAVNKPLNPTPKVMP